MPSGVIRWSRVARCIGLVMPSVSGPALPVTAQALTPGDSAAAFAVVYERVSERWGKSIDIREPVWIPDDDAHAASIGDETWEMLREHIPTIRRTRSGEAVLICPEQEEHADVRRCRIRDNGRVVSFGIQGTDAADVLVVRVSVTLMYSEERSYLYGGTCRVRRQPTGEWVVSEILDLRRT